MTDLQKLHYAKIENSLLKNALLEIAESSNDLSKDKLVMIAKNALTEVLNISPDDD